MKRKISLLMAICLMAGGTSISAKTLIKLPKKKYMLSHNTQFSPNGKWITFHTHDYRQTFSPNYLQIASATRGGLRQAFKDPVRTYTWKNNKEIIYYQDRAEGKIIIKEGNPLTGKAKTIFTKKLKELGSGYTRGWERYDIWAISPKGQILVGKEDKKLVIVDLPSGHEIRVSPYPKGDSSAKFSEDGKRLICYTEEMFYTGGRGETKRSYSLYEISSNRVKLIKKFTDIKGLQPSMDYGLSPKGDKIIFTQEKCKRGCFHEVYQYNVKTGKLLKNRTLRYGQMLTITFDQNFTKAVVNNMHRTIGIFKLYKKWKEAK